jgi:uncharacterized membrane protein YkgB
MKEAIVKSTANRVGATAADSVNRLARSLIRAMDRRRFVLLRSSIGIVFLWFGLLKFFPGLSPAESLASRTLSAITFHQIPESAEIVVLAMWECLVGALFISGRLLTVAFSLFWLHMAGTALPFLLFPFELFSHFPYAPTLEGQYVLKNIVIASAAFSIRRRWRDASAPKAASSTDEPASRRHIGTFTTDPCPISG